jgi:hypothetical protein
VPDDQVADLVRGEPGVGQQPVQSLVAGGSGGVAVHAEGGEDVFGENLAPAVVGPGQHTDPLPVQVGQRGRAQLPRQLRVGVEDGRPRARPRCG